MQHASNIVPVADKANTHSIESDTKFENAEKHNFNEEIY